MPFEYQFPDPRKADADGLLAVGGDLSTESLLTAYSRGIFPWYDEHSPILWWSPDPRLVLFPSKFKTSDSLNQRIRQSTYNVLIDNDFTGVIRQCSRVHRKGQKGTWLTPEMIEAYVRLYDEGFAHSFETWHQGKLVGGLYGVSLGKAFFGESMFHLMRDASKVALHALVKWTLKHEFHFIDAQQSTSHLISLGAEEVSRNSFLKMLDEALKFETIRGRWNSLK
ncbi:MAG TPA: leucyl/phenylalanyl-tRNA--protein transferase [Bacteroidales bacterium]|jgi:leucyl/phenylalanyl-tRNA--protein transferase|nr:leucyl/phenylalanyl-tRNA--protein transferase [Bacteroidales bacterium]